jgi:uncharacterized protein (TIGR02217 family)
MQFVDLQVSDRIALGARRITGWSTSLVATVGGFEVTNQNWARARHKFDIGFGVRTETDFDLVLQHFHTMRGRAKAFPFKDFLDFSATASRGVLQTVTAYTAYKLAKTYGTGADVYTRPITRPVVSTVKILRTRSATTTDITASCTITGTTGAVAITGGTVIAGDVLSWSGEFRVPVRYDTDEMPVVMPGGRAGADLLVQCEPIMLVEVRE